MLETILCGKLDYYKYTLIGYLINGAPAEIRGVSDRAYRCWEMKSPNGSLSGLSFRASIPLFVMGPMKSTLKP